jgi:hypothetical protein
MVFCDPIDATGYARDAIMLWTRYITIQRGNDQTICSRSLEYGDFGEQFSAAPDSYGHRHTNLQGTLKLGNT